MAARGLRQARTGRAALEGLGVPLALLAAPGCVHPPEGAFSAPVQRATLSSDTGTAAERSVELEFGVARDVDDVTVFPLGLNVGVGPRSEVFVGVEGVEASGERGVSDLALGARHRFWERGPTSAAVQLTTTLPLGGDEFGSEERGVLAALIGTRALSERCAVTAFVEPAWLDLEGRTEVLTTFALALDYALPDGFGAFAEVARIDDPAGGDPWLATIGMTRAITSAFSFDFGVAVGLDDDAPESQVLFGVTLIL